MEKLKTIRKHRNILILLIDIVVICISYFLVYIFKYENLRDITNASIVTTINTIIIAIIIYELILIITGIYKNITRFESGKQYIKYGIIAIFSSSTISVIQAIFNLNIHGFRTNLLAGFFIATIMITYRLLIRFTLNKEINLIRRKEDTRKKLLIIGAGDAGKEVIDTVQKHWSSDYKIVGIIDDNRYKLNYSIQGIRILGNRKSIKKICEELKIEEIFFAISNIEVKQKREILNICQTTGIKVKVLPGISDIIKDKKLYENLRDVEIEDLLRKRSYKIRK